MFVPRIPCLTDMIRRYIALRPRNATIDKFFVNCQNSKCTIQPIGINKFRGIPKLVATYLNLDNPEQYTGKQLLL